MLKTDIFRDNTEKIWAYRIFAKQKTDVPKVHKMKTGGLESAACPSVGVRGEGKGPKKFWLFSLKA